MTDAAERDRLDRLKGLARLWGALYLYHPALSVPDADWEKILVAAIPRIEAAATPADYAEALNDHLLRHLHDPWTHAAVPADRSSQAEFGTVTRRPSGAVWLRINAERAISPADRVAALANGTAEAGNAGVVLDLRGLERLGMDGWIALRATLGLFVDDVLPLPAKHERVHYGWTDAPGFGSSYQATWRMHAQDELLPLRAWGPERALFPQLKFDEFAPYAGPLAIVVSDAAMGVSSDMPAALQCAGRAWIVHESGLTDALDSSERLWGGVEASLRLFRLAAPGGWIEPKPDRSVAATADPAAVISVAEELLRGPRRPPGTVRPFFFARAKVRKDVSTGLAVSREERLAGLVKIWFVLGELFPHLEFVSGDWPTLLHEWIPRFERAEDREKHALALLQLAATLNDSHVRIEGLGDAVPFGDHFPALALYDAEGKAVITNVFGDAAARGLEAGMVVTAVDGRNIDDVAYERGQLISASTPGRRRSKSLSAALRGPKESEAVLAVENGVEKRVVGIPRSEPVAPTPSRTGEPIRRVEEFGYVDLDRVGSDDDIARAFKDFALLPGLLLDMRGYPCGPIQFSVVSRLIAVPSSSCSFHVPVRSGTLYSTRRLNGFGGELEWQLNRYFVEPDADLHFAGPVVVLIDEFAQSQSEDFCIYLRNARRATFVGSPTSGTDGNVTRVEVPGGASLDFTGMRVTYADGSRFQNIGIVPDVPARPTVAGLRAGRDEVLEVGVATLRRLVQASAGKRT